MTAGVIFRVNARRSVWWREEEAVDRPLRLPHLVAASAICRALVAAKAHSAGSSFAACIVPSHLPACQQTPSVPENPPASERTGDKTLEAGELCVRKLLGLAGCSDEFRLLTQIFQAWEACKASWRGHTWLSREHGSCSSVIIAMSQPHFYGRTEDSVLTLTI